MRREETLPYGFGLIVESVRGGDVVDLAFDISWRNRRSAVGARASRWIQNACGLRRRSVDLRVMERDVELGCERLEKARSASASSAPQAVMKMSRVQHQAQFPPRLTIWSTRARRRATESAPPESPTARRRPGRSRACRAEAWYARRMITQTVNGPSLAIRSTAPGI